MGFWDELALGIGLAGQRLGEGFQKGVESYQAEEREKRKRAEEIQLQKDLYTWITGQERAQKEQETAEAETRLGEFLAGAGVPISQKRQLTEMPKFTPQMPGEEALDYLYNQLVAPPTGTRVAPTRVPVATLPYLSKLLPGMEEEKEDRDTMVSLYKKASQGDPNAQAALNTYADIAARAAGLKTGAVEEVKRGLPREMTSAEEKAHQENLTKAARIAQLQELYSQYVKGSTIGGVGPVAGRATGVVENLPFLGKMFVSPGVSQFRQELAQIAGELRHEKFGGALSPQELSISRTFIPSPEMTEQQLEASLRSYIAIYEWAARLQEYVSRAPRGERAEAAREFREKNPFPIAMQQAKQGTTTGTPAIGDIKVFPNGAVGKWDGKGWVKQ
jgi:hypothetical protein